MTIEGEEYCCEACEACFVGRDICPDCGGDLVNSEGIRAEDDIEEEKDKG